MQMKIGISSDKNTSLKRRRKTNKIKKKSILKSINSIYNLREIFSFLNTKQKLEIIIYNLHFQNILRIYIEDYKKFSGRYIIYKKKGKGKEYNLDNILLYQGEYFNGERNGKGKEFCFDGNIEFQGDFLRGKRSGKGKEFYFDGHIEFQGDFLRGKRNGKGK